MKQKARSNERAYFSWRALQDSRTRFARAQSLGASACVRIPKNVPLARFLNGIPPQWVRILQGK